MTRRKSVTGFICGLIGSLFSLGWGFFFGVIGNAGEAVGLDSVAKEVNVFSILGWLAFLGAIVGIVGAAMSLKDARKGGIVSVFSTIATAILQIYVFVNLLKIGTLVMSLIIICLLPVVLQVVAVVSELLAKPVEVNYPAYNNMQMGQGNIYQPQQPVNAQAPVAGNSLEQELTDLKGMLDKGLLTEEEYAEAKKNVIAKHSK